MTTAPPMLSVVVAGRNDNYGGNFDERLLRATRHNVERLEFAKIAYEYVFVEWNPVAGRPLLSHRFVREVPHSRAFVVPAEIHEAYTLNAEMAFHEMAAKNVGIRRALGEFILVTNADILFDEELVNKLGRGDLSHNTFYRAHRIDVAADARWPQVTDHRNQLPSGEGRHVPPYYLGGGGDFAMASRALWAQMTGWNESIRFTTRAKDWQFYLSAAARDIRIAFLGDVYHLDHAAGFRNTPPDERNSPSAHFGQVWDFEFGLPVTNGLNWGMASCGENGIAERIATLRSDGPLVTPQQDIDNRLWHTWLTRPHGHFDWTSLLAFYALLDAERRRVPVVARIETGAAAVALAGMSRVAESAGVRVLSNWTWPDHGHMHMRAYAPEPLVVPESWVVLTESQGRWRAEASGLDITTALLPTRREARQPQFNPLLCRRLLRACFRMRTAGHHRVAIFGTGGHTEELMTWGLPDDLELTAFVDSSGDLAWFDGLPVIRPSEIDPTVVDGVLLSSVTYETEMLEALGNSAVPVVPLYCDWPADIWAPTTAQV